MLWLLQSPFRGTKMKTSRLIALVTCSITACESPTRSVDSGKINPPIAEARPTAAPSITVTALPAAGAARANGINDAGTIVGWASDATGTAAAVKWTFAGGTWTATALGGGPGSASAINAGGNIVGVANNRAMMWPAVGGSVALDCTTDVGSDRAFAINSSGIVGGTRYADAAGVAAAVVWRPGQCRQDLANLPGGTWAEVDGIDDAGNAIGYAADADIGGSTSAVRWTVATNTSWNRPEKLTGGLYAGATAINAGNINAGNIAGSACVGGPPPGCSVHAMLWASLGTATPTDLHTLGGLRSAAYAINSAIEVAGWSQVAHSGATYGFIWSATTGMRALNPLKSDSHSEAYGINNAQTTDGSRQVVGFSSGRSGTQRAVVWRVP
jgi:uncharacterized membrane protein